MTFKGFGGIANVGLLVWVHPHVTSIDLCFPADRVFGGLWGESFCGSTRTPVVPVNPIEPPDVPDDLIPTTAVSGAVERAQLAPWTSAASVIRVDIDAQLSPGLTTDFARDPAYDVTRGGVTYYGYSYQSSTENRKAVVLVRGSGGARAMVAMEPGQFASGAPIGGPDMFHSGGATYRADVFVRPTNGGLFNYSGSYAGLLNFGTPAGTPPGSLAPTSPYRTSGTSLITADFTRMKMSGGITGRQIEDTGTALPDVALWTTAINATGDFNGVVYIGDGIPPVEQAVPQSWTATGRYQGIFSGSDARDVAMILLFQPIGGGDNWEQGSIVGPCTVSSAGTCP